MGAGADRRGRHYAGIHVCVGENKWFMSGGEGLAGGRAVLSRIPRNRHGVRGVVFERTRTDGRRDGHEICGGYRLIVSSQLTRRRTAEKGQHRSRAPCLSDNDCKRIGSYRRRARREQCHWTPPGTFGTMCELSKRPNASIRTSRDTTIRKVVNWP